MKVAVVGSRGIETGIERYLPKEVDMIISGGARGVDRSAQGYADKFGIPKKIFLPDYEKFGRYAPLKRNERIVMEADIVIAVWDGKSRGTKYTIDYAKKIGKPVRVFKQEPQP